MTTDTLLSSLLAEQDALLRTFITVVMLVAGHAAAKITSFSVRKIWIRGDDLTKKELERRYDTVRYLKYALDSVVILAGLVYLNTGLTATLTSTLAQSIPKIASAVLVGLLGLILVNLTAKVGGKVLKGLGVRDYLRDAGISKNATNGLRIGAQGFLYLLVIQIVLDSLGVGNTFISEAITASSYAVVGLGAALIFWGFKDIFKNLAAGFYLKNTRLVRPGEKVYLEDESGEIRGIDLFSTEIETDGGYTMITKNSDVMNADLKFKKTQNDVETLEDMKEYFIAQDPSYCGPASAEMALSIFGYRYGQDEIGEICGTEVGQGTMPDDLIGAIEGLTDGEVHAEYVEYDKITDLADEFKVWFNDGALIIPNFAKPVLFPQADTAHYSLCVGVEGDELLIVDPSADTVSGGVYYADSGEMLEAMREFEGRTRGYLVLAPEDTTAYWRISKGLLYADETFYDQLNKNMELQLRRILRQGRILKNVLPDQLQDYLDRWKREENVERLWKPESEREQEGDKEDEQTSDTGQ